MKNFLLFSFFVILLLSNTSCSRKRVNFKNKLYHKLTAYDNTLFNGKQTLKEILSTNENSYADDYYAILRVQHTPEVKVSEDFFANPEDEIEQDKKKKANIDEAMKGIFGMGFPSIKKNTESKATATAVETKPATGLDRVSFKSKKAIKSHSMFDKKRLKEENNMMATAYLLLAEARYYQGRPIPALNALDYVELFMSEKSSHYYDVLLYQAKANEMIGNFAQSEIIYKKLLEKEKLSKKLKHEICQNYAQYLINQKDYNAALDVLETAKKYTWAKKNRARYTYIQGQLLQAMGENKLARRQYNRVFKKRPGFEFEVKAQVTAATTFDKANDDYESFKNSLINQTRKGVYDPYRNEIFYAIANLAFKNDLDKEANKFINKSLEEKMSDPEIRGLAFGLKGDLEFNKYNYIESAAFFDSAVAKITNKEIKAKYEDLSKRIDDIKQKHYIIIKNDSILSIVRLSDEERIKRINEIIVNIKLEEEKEALAEKKEKKKRKRIYTSQENQLIGDSSKNKAIDKGGFYFYSKNLADKGKIEFKKEWGNRQLVDNWRLVVKKNTINLPNANKNEVKTTVKEEKDSLLGKKEPKNPRRFDLDYYLESLPEKESIEEARLKLERDSAQLFLGQLYYDKFGNKDLAISTLKKLIYSPPALIPVEREAYYTIFRISEEENIAGSDTLSQHIVAKYPDWTKAYFLKNKSSGKFQLSSEESIKLYEKAYNAYENGDYSSVYNYFVLAKEKYYSDKIIEKFYMLDAYAKRKSASIAEFREALEIILIEIPKNSEVYIQAEKLLTDLPKSTKKEVLNKKDSNQLEKVEKTTEEKVLKM